MNTSNQQDILPKLLTHHYRVIKAWVNGSKGCFEPVESDGENLYVYDFRIGVTAADGSKKLLNYSKHPIFYHISCMFTLINETATKMELDIEVVEPDYVKNLKGD